MTREFNLSWGTMLQTGNKVVAGRWHGEAGRAELSIEQGISERLGIALGDTLTFDIGGQPVTGTVSSIRKLEWDSMQVNFFVVASPGLLEQFSASYITSFYLPPGRGDQVRDLVSQFPNLTVVDVGAIVAQVLELTERLVKMINFVLLFALVAGVVVLLAALQSTHDERIYELSVLRTLGARNRQLRTAMLAEFAVLGVLSALLSLLGAVAIGYALSTVVFELPYSPRWSALGGVALVAAAAVVAVGWAGIRGLLRRSVLEGLRAAA
jgi:putative ABC transport system permease protein